ncbi:hypothetical protein ABL78_0064 [Leptomonas seymouri]|uniref:WLM domain-containing protein n=1 Tax=Leptomonas seymouri TaxID=5684 RepID=A0A0N1IAV8_LEPSE|nr:hypothetical protein ABL78_0064 [Leptomonas seymouri]|eukprot:KPI90831.1 hypothetical protein ABL78_0064 [Leptomonas seymouri]
MSNAFMAQLPYIGTTSTLGWHNDPLAQSYMEHIVRRARVLLPRRGWRVGIIKEFYPRGASLLGLNVNAGSEVCLRFRVPGKRNEFLPFHEVLCTALHEFTHCMHSRHDRVFWNSYYDLVKECEALEVAMLQKGEALYPEAAYVTSTNAKGASPSSSSKGVKASRRGDGRGNSGRAFPSRGGKRLGGAQSSPSRGNGRGAGATTCSGSATTTTTTTTRPVKTSTTAPVSSPNHDGKENAAFPGQGRRLGRGVGLQRYDAPPGPTPTWDALRCILASAAERRLALSGGTTAPSGAVCAPPTGTRNPPLPRPGTRGGLSEEVPGEGDLPCHIPPPQSATRDSNDSWRCPRCGFCNEADVRSCQLCDNDDVDDAASLSDDDGDVREPPTKKLRDAAMAKATAANSSSPSSLPPASLGTCRDNPVEISDEDDG